MKKILSILVFVLLGIGTMYGQSAGSSTIHAYAIYDPDCDSIYEQGGGTVQAKAIKQGSTKVSDYNIFGDEGTYSTAEGKGYYSKGILGMGKKEYGYTIAADVKSAIDGYYFAKWCDVDTFGAKSMSTSTTRSYSLKYNESVTRKTYAFFEPIKISNADVKQHAYTTDSAGVGEGLVWFRVNKQSNGLRDFTWYLEQYSASYDPAGFEIVDAYHRDGSSYDTIYVQVKFTNQNRNAADRVYVVLQSKGKSPKTSSGGISTSELRKQLMYGYSDLKPVFTTNPTDTLDFTPDTPLETGSSVEQTIQTSWERIVTGHATWKVTLLDKTNANANGFTLVSASAEKNPVVRFTAMQGINQADLTAKLEMQATYKDSKNANVIYKDTIILTGDAGKVITLNGAQATTRTISIEHSATETWQEETVEFLTTLSGIEVTPNGFPSGADENKIQYVWREGDTEVKVRLNSTMTPGFYTPTVKFASTGVEADLTIEALVYLQKPQVSVLPNKLGNAVRLTWNQVLDATHYVVTSNGISLDTIVADKNSYEYDAKAVGKEMLAIGKEYKFAVEAIYAPDEHANRLSDSVVAIPAIPESITFADLSDLNMYTGTDIHIEGHATYGKEQYRQKYAIDLLPTFSNSGTPLFGRLYVFGMTTSLTPVTAPDGQVGYTITAANSSAGSDAITPCYIYEPNGDAYELVATITNMNMSDKNATYFTLTANSQKYYLTGFCPYATTGWGTGQAGVWMLSGEANAKIDLYLHNLCVFARAHTDNGKIATTQATAGDNNVVTYNFASSITNITTTLYMDVTAAVLVFKTSNENAAAPFLPTIHLLGDNELEGGVGCVRAGALGSYTYAGMHSSAIHVLTTSDKQCTTLSVDDKWIQDSSGSTIRTNGMLDVAPAGNGRPSIDLGNAKTTLDFNGGQIFLKNSTPSSTSYLSTFAIGYRKFTKDFSMVEATLYGLGDDQEGGNVNFNDGTINCDTLTDDFMRGTYGQYYFNKYTMKCPKNTKINGGSHNCDIMACSGPAASGGSPTNKWGETLVSTQVAITNVPIEPYYLAEIDFAVDPGMLKCVKTDDPYYNMTLNEYYAQKGESYLHESMKAKNGEVTLMVPVQFTDKEAVVEVLTHNWALCTPEVGASSNGVTISLGGSTTVISDETNKTSYLLFGEVDQYMQTASESYTIPEGEMGGGANISLSDQYMESILNEDAYQIEKAQYILKPLKQADEWMLFVPPFDITNVYVLESYPESDLVDFAEKQGIDDALIKQAGATMDFFYYICNYAGGSNGGTNGNLWALHDQWKRNTKYIIGDGKKQLTHFTGRNYTANYYLQHSSGVWEWDGSKFKTDWKYLPAKGATDADAYYKVMHGDTEYDVIMKKGEVYSLNFPYMYYGYRDEQGQWDYWSGKYIIFEGLGPQTIEGTNYHETIRNSIVAENGKAIVCGNSTLAAMESNQNAYFLDRLGDTPQRFTGPYGDTETVDPTNGYILANASLPSPAPKRIKTIDIISGDVTYEEDEHGSQNTTTSTPTIAGDNKMLVYTISGGVGIIPVVEQQVSIYNAAGGLVHSQYLTSEVNIPLPTGIYLICGEHEQYKVLVK